MEWLLLTASVLLWVTSLTCEDLRLTGNCYWQYPEDLEQDSFALLCFRLYLLLSHGKWYKKGSNRK